MAFGTRHNEVYKIFRLHLFTDLLLLVSDISLPTHRNIIQGKTQRQREIYFGEASKQNFPLRSPYVAFPEPSCIWKVLHGDLCALPGPSDCVAPSEKVNDAEMSKACRPYRKIQIARPFLSPLTHQPRRKALRPGSPRGDALPSSSEALLPSRPVTQAQFICDHHGQPRPALQRRHAGGDASLDYAAAAVQGRHPGGGPGVHRQR